ncbi:MAG: hypothetical protein JWN34_4316 [Bryobacterales bacterium]|nr:hypothetical protein [Bryobacterales bacterium]
MNETPGCVRLWDLDRCQAGNGDTEGSCRTGFVGLRRGALNTIGALRPDSGTPRRPLRHLLDRSSLSDSPHHCSQHWPLTVARGRELPRSGLVHRRSVAETGRLKMPNHLVCESISAQFRCTRDAGKQCQGWTGVFRPPLHAFAVLITPLPWKRPWELPKSQTRLRPTP